MWKELLTARTDVLRRQEGIRLQCCVVHDGIEEDLLQRVVSESGWSLPSDLLDIYREMNGLELNWSLMSSGEEISGAIVLLPLQKAMFGYAERIERARFDDAFKDSLWTADSFSDESIRELKQHRVLEAIAGEPAFVTFKPAPVGIALFFVYEEDILPIQVPIAEYMRLIFEYLGAARIREHLTQCDWKQKIESDEKLTAVREMR
jgi:hypothetical protein